MKKPSMLRLSVTALITTCTVLLSGCAEVPKPINDDLLHDATLTGRWRAADGRYIDLWANGNADTDLDIYEAYFDDAVNLTITSTWTGGNGQLTFSTDYWAKFGYEYFSDDDAFYIKGKNNSKGARYYRVAGVPGSGLDGDWNTVTCYFTFCEDGTGLYFIISRYASENVILAAAQYTRQYGRYGSQKTA